ncbi:MAG: sel1 repeat family protein [Ruminococcaceae bacterium]|nr:sel1 repeat family protein [Oscillospiraceae bacterium]
MIKCKNCEYQCDYTGRPCPICGAKNVITKEDIDLTARELAAAVTAKNPQKIRSCRHLLADGGDVESMREYAKMLEKGDYQTRDIDGAMNYYYKAAKKLDSYSAYRFSKLSSRSSTEHSKFWLRFAALLGSIDSYPDAAELFASEGKEQIAAYYTALAAECNDTLSIVNMAKRWSEGKGVRQNSSYAKWYLDKLSIPPISAIKLAYKLRSVHPEEPQKLTFPDFYRYLRLLADNAKSLGFDSAYFYLTSLLANNGDINAECALGVMLLEGKGCERNEEKALAVLEMNITHKNPAAAVYLGEEYLAGRFLEKNNELAMKYFKKASDLGYPEAYERLGDIYRCAEGADKDVGRAIELYELAAAGGCASARAKAAELKAKREEFFFEAYETINLKKSVTPDEAFSAFRAAAIATAMGEIKAATLLARCYAFGFGTKKDRPSAFFWYKHAAEGGDTDAFLYLGLCYSRGIGTRFSFSDAVKWLHSAAEGGNKIASDELSVLLERKMKRMISSLYAKSMELIYMKKYRDAAELLTSYEQLGHPKSLYTLGCLYEFGRGVKSSRRQAEEYYERAFRGSALGSFKDPASRYKLKILKMMR